MLVGHLFRHFIFSKRSGALVKRIAILSVIGITVSVTAFLIVLFVMNGMNASIKKRILALEPHLYVTVLGATKASLLENHPVLQRIRENPQNKAYVYETQDVIIRSQDGQFRGGIARGVSRESLAFLIEQLKRLDQEKGAHHDAFFWDPQDVPDNGEVIMGVDLAQSLGVYEGDFVTVVSPEGLLLPPGETPKFEKVRIKKIITTSLSDMDSQYIFYQRGLALNGISSPTTKKLGIEVWTANESQLDDLKKEVMKFEDVHVETWMERNSALFYALKLEKLTIGIFLGLAGMIAASSILTVLALLLSQKRRDIAIMRTIGLSGRRAVHIFTQMGFMLAFTGVFTGVIIGTGVSLYIQKYPINFLPTDIYYDSQIPALVDPWLIVGVLVVSTLIAFLGAYIPARTALEVEPSQALRIK